MIVFGHTGIAAYVARHNMSLKKICLVLDGISSRDDTTVEISGVVGPAYADLNGGFASGRFARCNGWVLVDRYLYQLLWNTELQPVWTKWN